MSRIIFDVTSIVDISEGIRTGIPRVEFAVFEYLSNSYNGSVAFSVNPPTKKGFIRVDKNCIQNCTVKIRRRTLFYKLKKSILKRLGKRVTLNRWVIGGNFEAWQFDDRYLSISNIWEAFSKNDWQQLRSATGVKVTFFCHDLAPLVVPHLYSDITRLNFSWSLNVLNNADLVICNSLFTQRELARLTIKGEHVAKNIVVPLNATTKPVDPTDSSPVDFLVGKRFILSVSTIHARKNYDFLLKVWASLYECSEISDVKLVIVGSKSWGGDFITKLLQTDPQLFDRVHHISKLSDKKLDWLYKNCIFTVYPSLYEGWGLPITESLSYGKACVASSTSSMPEASQGLGLHIDPTDTNGWTAKIKMLIDDERYRENIEQEIKSKFVFNSWDAIAERIVTNVDLLT